MLHNIICKVGLVAIIAGFIWEDKLIEFEDAITARFKRVTERKK